MLGAERIRFIHARIDRDSAVKVDELARELQVSAITIRRDLKTLEEQGKLTRTYGGAVSTDNRIISNEENYDDKKIHTHGAKTAMARRCLELIPNSASLILDAGTSTFEVARLLGMKKNITAITSDLRIASELYQIGCHTFVAGGEIQNSTGALLGPYTEQFYSEMNVEVGIIGVAGISSEGILYTPTMGKAKLKQEIMRVSSVRVLLADSVKFNISSFWRISSLDAFDHIITDIDYSEEEWEKRGVDPDKVCHVVPDAVK